MHHYILIDQSGSMHSRWNETLGTVNGYVENIIDAKDRKKHKFTVATFDSTGSLNFREIRRDVSKKDWTNIGSNEAQPRGSTPLFDAVGKLVTLVNEDAPKKAAVVIITDGYENASTEMTKESAKAAVGSLEKKGYDVTFVGADFDAMDEAAQIGVSVGKTLNMNTRNFRDVSEILASKSAMYASTGQSVMYSAEERAKAAE